MISIYFFLRRQKHHIFAAIINSNLIITMENFEQIINSDSLVLVDFYATWCQPCQMMHPILDTLKEQVGDKVRILKLDVEKNEKLSADYQIRSVPTMLLIKNGQVLWRHSGTKSLQELSTLIEQFALS